MEKRWKTICGKYLLVVVNGAKKSIVTVFITDKVKIGEVIWPNR